MKTAACSTPIFTVSTLIEETNKVGFTPKRFTEKNICILQAKSIFKTTIKAYTQLNSFSSFSGAKQSSRLILPASTLQEEANTIGFTQKGFTRKYLCNLQIKCTFKSTF